MSDQATALLELTGVVKGYPTPGGEEATPVLRGVDLSVAAGETVAIAGPSGSGKSTLLNIIGALDRPDAGRVLLDGADLATLSEAELAAVRGARIGFVFQLHHLLPQCTVLENVLIPTLARQAPKAKSASEASMTTLRAVPPRARAKRSPSASEASLPRALRLLDRVGLGGRVQHRPGQLSGGERQRVAVVRALINQPGLLLADEPTGSLDRASAESLTQLLLELNREEGVALIVVTHSASLAAQMGRVVELKDGRLVPMAPSPVPTTAAVAPTVRP